MNNKQQDLAYDLFEQLKTKYSGISLKSIVRSPEDPNDFCLNIIAPLKEEVEIELQSYAAEIATNILLDYGYLFIVLTENPILETEFV